MEDAERGICTFGIVVASVVGDSPQIVRNLAAQCIGIFLRAVHSNEVSPADESIDEASVGFRLFVIGSEFGLPSSPFQRREVHPTRADRYS